MLGYFFNNPDAYEDKPVGFAGNQIGHTGLGGAFGFALIGHWWHAVALLVGYAIWEWLQWRLKGAKKWDCWEDAAFVMAGVLAIYDLLVLAPAIAHLWAGYKRREIK